MLTTILILNLVNLIGLTIAGVIFFKRSYVIVAMEEWNMVTGVYNLCATNGLIDGEGNLVEDVIPQEELPGGYGFFKDEIPVEEDQEEEE